MLSIIIILPSSITFEALTYVNPALDYFTCLNALAYDDKLLEE
jgi:hypothetical protein